MKKKWQNKLLHSQYSAPTKQADVDIPCTHQTEYIYTRRTRETLHGLLMDFTEERLGIFLSRFGQVSAVTSKAGIATRNILQITMTRKDFMDIRGISCRSWNILVIVEGRRLHC